MYHNKKSKNNLHLSLSNILKSCDNSQEEIIKKKIARVLYDPLSKISYYQGKVPLMSIALKHVKPRSKDIEQPFLKSYNVIFQQLYANLNFISNLSIGQRNPYHYPLEYTYQITQEIIPKPTTTLYLKSLPNIAGFVSLEVFYQLLSIYEHNQYYYIKNCIHYDHDLYCQYITALEQWWLNIIEPIPTDPILYKDWYERENSKYLGSTFYCNELIIDDLLPLNFSYLVMCHSQLVNYIQT